MKRTKRRHNTGFGYIGAGNNASVFNRKPKTVFSKIKDDLNSKSLDKHQLQFSDKNISQEEKETIKNRIRKEKRRKNIITLILSILVLTPLILGAIAIFEGLLIKNK